MYIKDVYAALEGLENGKEMIEALQSEFKQINSESARRRIEKREILEALGLTDSAQKDELTEIKNMINSIKDNGGDPLTLTSKLTALEKQVKTLTEANAAAEKAKVEEYNKRINQLKQSKALEVLAAQNAANPSVISQLVLNNMQYNNETDSIDFIEGDSKITVEEGIQKFLSANPYLIKNTQQPGSGAAVNNNNNSRTFTAEDIQKMSMDEINKNWDTISK